MFSRSISSVAALGGFLALSQIATFAQGERWAFPCPTNDIARYTAHRVTQPIKIDGKLDEAAWKAAPTSPRFVDILSGQPVLHDTRATVLWDEDYLYVGYQLEEPNVRARFTNYNDTIYYDNDVELFIAGRDSYYEFEINGFNTIYEVFFIWDDAYEKAGFAKAPEFARSKLKPFNGVDFKTHPRGGRLGNFDWPFPGLKTAVHIDGTVNNDKDKDRGWSVEVALPWKGMKWLATDGRSLPPKDGDVWRMDFSRFNTYKAPPPAKDSGGWVWTRHGIWDSHIPECFAFIQFSTNAVSVLKR
ncbi:MAG: carbohydrate-binding family 9-like protein [Opitutaceae bacterium]|nr:carbohydrate-binding family 9-like protein [Verrucomicrobiales bacterium]